MEGAAYKTVKYARIGFAGSILILLLRAGAMLSFMRYSGISLKDLGMC